MKSRNYLLGTVAVIALAAIGLTRTITTDILPAHSADANRGERLFWAGGCASCHATPVDGKRARGDDKLLLGGGLELETPFGVFNVPNISPHLEDGIGNWSMVEFVNAMQYGVSPDDRHYYPSFPYASYAKMKTEDVMDLRAYLSTLPPVAGTTPDHSLKFPWSIRRGIGLWKRMSLSADPVVAVTENNDRLLLGRYLVESVGHCGECHTPRDGFGGMIAGEWLGGAVNPDGEGSVPDITPSGENVSSWSANDIAYYLESGFTPDFDTVGGTMVAVQENTSKLSTEDRAAIAAYLKAVPAAHPKD